MRNIDHVESQIQGIIQSKFIHKFSQGVLRDISDELNIILQDKLKVLRVAGNFLIIEYIDHNKNRKGFRIDINDFTKS